MKKTIMCLLFIFLTCGFVFSHSGKTDKNGGHWDHKTNTYHYHNSGSSNRESSRYELPVIFDIPEWLKGSWINCDESTSFTFSEKKIIFLYNEKYYKIADKESNGFMQIISSEDQYYFYTNGVVIDLKPINEGVILFYDNLLLRNVELSKNIK